MTEHDEEHDEAWYRARFEAAKAKMIEEWGECPAADELEAAMLAAPMPSPDGTPVQTNPLPMAYFLGVEVRDADPVARLEDRLLPHAKVECLPDGTVGPVRYRADLTVGDEVAYDDVIEET